MNEFDFNPIAQYMKFDGRGMRGARFIDPGTATLIAAGAGIGASFLGGTKSKKLKIPPQITEAWNRLLEIAGQPSPDQPLRGTAPLTEIENLIQQITQGFITQQRPESEAALASAMQQLTQGLDPLAMPGFKDLFGTILQAGQLEGGRLSRAIQGRGGTATTGGERMTDEFTRGLVQRLSASFTPIVQQLLSIRTQAPGLVEDILRSRDVAATTRIGVGTAVGAIKRGVKQSELDAEFNRILREIEYETIIKPNLLKAVLGGAIEAFPTEIRGGEPSTFSQFAPLIERILAAGIGGGAPGRTPGAAPGLAASIPGVTGVGDPFRLPDFGFN